jgi:hypothetical protein
MADDPPPPDYDVVLLHGPTDDGNGSRVLRARPGQLEVGEVRPVREGQPVNGAEVVTLRPRDGTPNVCDVDVVHAKPAPAREAKGDRHGPAQVATNAYRTRYDRVFGNPSAARRDSN